MILDAGPTERGLESTIVAPDEDHIRLLRPGPITAEMLHSLTSLPVPGAQGGKIEAPVHLLTHYAPSKPLRLTAPSSESHTFQLLPLIPTSYPVFCFITKIHHSLS